MLQFDYFAYLVGVIFVVIRGGVLLLLSSFFGAEIEHYPELERIVLVFLEAKPIGAKKIAVRATAVAHKNLLVLLNHILAPSAQAKVICWVFIIEPGVVLFFVFIVA